MHPDQFTPDSHRTKEPDSLQTGQAAPARVPEEDQDTGAVEAGERGSTEVRTPEPDAPRMGEAGSQYVGRQMDDRLKANPRVDDAGDVEGHG